MHPSIFLDECTDLQIIREYRKRQRDFLNERCTYCQKDRKECNCKMKNVPGMVERQTRFPCYVEETCLKFVGYEMNRETHKQEPKIKE